MGDAKLVIQFAVSSSADGIRRHQIDRINISGNVSLVKFQVADFLGMRPELVGERTLQLCVEFSAISCS
jgi:hypothetical protein